MKWTTKRPTIEGPYVIFTPEWHRLDDGCWECMYLCVPDEKTGAENPLDPDNMEPYWDDNGQLLIDDLLGSMYLGPLPKPE